MNGTSLAICYHGEASIARSTFRLKCTRSSLVGARDQAEQHAMSQPSRTFFGGGVGERGREWGEGGRGGEGGRREEGGGREREGGGGEGGREEGGGRREEGFTKQPWVKPSKKERGRKREREGEGREDEMKTEGSSLTYW